MKPELRGNRKGNRPLWTRIRRAYSDVGEDGAKWNGVIYLRRYPFLVCHELFVKIFRFAPGFHFVPLFYATVCSTMDV